MNKEQNSLFNNGNTGVRELTIIRKSQCASNPTAGTSSPSQSLEFVSSIQSKITQAKRLEQQQQPKLLQQKQCSEQIAITKDTQEQVQQRSREKVEKKQSQKPLLRRTSSSIEEKNKNASVVSRVSALPSPKLSQQKNPTFSVQSKLEKPMEKPTLRLLLKQKACNGSQSPQSQQSMCGVESDKQNNDSDQTMEIEKAPLITKKRLISEVITTQQEQTEETQVEDQITKKFKKSEDIIQQSTAIVTEEQESQNKFNPHSTIAAACSPNQTNDTADECHTSESSSVNSPQKAHAKSIAFSLDAASEQMELEKQQEEYSNQLKAKEEDLRIAKEETARVIAQAEEERLKLQAQTAQAILTEQNARIAAEVESARQASIAEATKIAAEQAILDVKAQVVQEKNAKIAQKSDALKSSIAENKLLIESKREQILKVSSIMIERLTPEALEMLKEKAKQQSQLLFSQGKNKSKRNSLTNMRILDCILKSNVKFLDNLKV